MIELTQEQKQTHDTIIDFLSSNRKLLTFGGLAGCGKTTTISLVAKTLKSMNKKLAFCAISGKASSVLRSKLKGILTDEDYCGTVHSFIYQLVGKKKLESGRTELYFESDEDKELFYDIIFLDEASMCDEWTFNDLSKYGIRIVAVGDHKQLPPVKGRFNLMENPEIKLETIMRQAEGNPIIQLATMARNGDPIEYGQYGHCLKTRDISYLHSHDFKNPNAIILCALNKTRVRMNAFARDKIGNVVNYPIAGEPVICLFNNHKKMIFNGNIGVLESINDFGDHYNVDITMGDFTYSGDISKEQFGKEYTEIDDDSEFDYFDWGWCISVWKSQGSEFNDVLLMEEGEFFIKDNWPRFLIQRLPGQKKE